MNIRSIAVIASLAIAGAAIYGFAANGQLIGQASSAVEVEKDGAACDYSKEAMGDHMKAASADGSKECDYSKELAASLTLVDDAGKKDGEDCDACPIEKSDAKLEAFVDNAS